MDTFSASRPLVVFLLAFFLGCSISACKKKAAMEKAQALATPSSSQTVPTTGSTLPAIVGRGEGSFANYVHFPKDPATANLEGAVQFYCDIAEDGTVATTYAVVCNQKALVTAVQSALDWGKFQPATIGGKPVPVYLGGTVLFFHQDRRPIIAISLVTYDRERVGKLTNYIQPQLIGGLRPHLEKAERASTIDLPAKGAAEVVVSVGEHAEITSTSVLAENPKEIGLGDFLISAIKDAQFTSAYSDGKPTAGAMNVVANFGEF
jgi:Gram-negative bacterial TonB protein C-terminal